MNRNYNSNVSSEINNHSYIGNNTPNPFKNSTTIKYGLGINTTTASIHIYDLQGSQITSYILDPTQKEGILTIAADTLSPGMYIYTLIVDNQEIATKKMIVTE